MDSDNFVVRRRKRFKISQNCDMHQNIVRYIFNDLRERISHKIEHDPPKLGGQGIVCQIDESLFCYKQKYHRDRIKNAPVWGFGIVDTSVKPARGFIQIVPNRSAEALLSIMANVCRPGTIIHSNGWTAYRNIYDLTGFEHFTVNKTAFTRKILNHIGRNRNF